MSLSETEKKALGKKIKNERENRNMSVAKLLSAIGSEFDEGNFRSVERGARQPPLKLLLQLRSIGFDINKLFDEVNSTMSE